MGNQEYKTLINNNKLLFPLKSSENHNFFDDFRGNSSEFAWISLILEAKFGDDPLTHVSLASKYVVPIQFRVLRHYPQKVIRRPKYVIVVQWLLGSRVDGTNKQEGTNRRLLVPRILWASKLGAYS